MTNEEAQTVFAALANADRLSVLRRLVRAGGTGLSAGEIAEALGASPSRASFHLASLAQAGLVESARQARRVTYRLNFARLGALAAFLLHDCCADHPKILACCRTETGTNPEPLTPSRSSPARDAP